MTQNLDRLFVQELADCYPDHSSARRLLGDAKVPRLGMIAWTDRPLDTWYSITKHAKAQGKLLSLMDVAIGEYPDNAIFHAARYEELQGLAAAQSIVLEWRHEVPERQLEKIMGNQSTLLPISFLSVGLQRARAVARVICRDGTMATGFLTPNDLFVTNHHVLSNAADAECAVAEFGYDQEGHVSSDSPVRIGLRPADGFATSPSHDCTVARTEEGATRAWGAIPVAKCMVEEVTWVNIIQHAEGKPKQISLYHNIVAYADADQVQYYTDTLPGSSGSPVFDSNWNLVAVHRAGGSLYEPGGHRWVYRNEGMNVNHLVRLMADL